MARAPFGPDTLAIEAYLARGDDDPGLAAWKREHPDWFVAGTWTAPASARPARPPQPASAGATGRFQTAAEMARLATTGTAPLDPATLSHADFERVVAAAQAETASDDD